MGAINENGSAGSASTLLSPGTSREDRRTTVSGIPNDTSSQHGSESSLDHSTASSASTTPALSLEDRIKQLQENDSAKYNQLLKTAFVSSNSPNSVFVCVLFISYIQESMNLGSKLDELLKAKEKGETSASAINLDMFVLAFVKQNPQVLLKLEGEAAGDGKASVAEMKKEKNEEPLEYVKELMLVKGKGTVELKDLMWKLSNHLRYCSVELVSLST